MFSSHPVIPFQRVSYAIPCVTHSQLNLKRLSVRTPTRTFVGWGPGSSPICECLVDPYLLAVFPSECPVLLRLFVRVDGRSEPGLEGLLHRKLFLNLTTYVSIPRPKVSRPVLPSFRTCLYVRRRLLGRLVCLPLSTPVRHGPIEETLHYPSVPTNTKVPVPS